MKLLPTLSTIALLSCLALGQSGRPTHRDPEPKRPVKPVPPPALPGPGADTTKSDQKEETLSINSNLVTVVTSVAVTAAPTAQGD